MRAATEYEGELKDAVLRLEDEVASWRSRRTERHGTTTGKVHMVRISKRVLPRSRPSTDQAFLTVRP
jgi:hypothetical protein